MDYTEILEQLKEWACNQLIMQYRYAPKNREFIKVLSDTILANVLILKIRDLCLNVEESIGAQLDVVGQWVGIDRYDNAIDLWEQPYTALVNYSNVADNTYEQWQGGYSLYSNFENHLISIVLNEVIFKNAVNYQENTYVFKYTASGWQLDGENITISNYGITYPLTNNIAINDTITINYFDDIITYKITSDNMGGFLTYKAWQDTRTKVNQMGDDIYRQLIKLKIIKNSIVFTNKNIDDAIWKWSNGQVYTTWGVMEVTYHYPSSMHNLFQLAVYKNVLLAPTGCTINLIEE